MEMPKDVFIKEEKNCIDIDYEEYEVDNRPPLRFDVKVKIESDPQILEDIDWCVQNTPDLCDTLNYKELIAPSEQQCLLCHRIFSDSYTLLQHNLNHLAVTLITPHMFQCDHCSVYFTNKGKLKEHIAFEHKGKRASCDNESFLVTKMLHQCNICAKIFTYNNWRSHMRDVHSDTVYKCSKCNITFKCQRYLNRHTLYKHEGVRPSWRFHKEPDTSEAVKCSQCTSIFHNKNSLKTHVRNCHSDGIHKCDICESKLKSKSYLLTHMRRVHYNDGKEHVCLICRKKFKSPRYLRIHKKNSHSKWLYCNVRAKQGLSESET